jgi:hypothetical protein
LSSEKGPFPARLLRISVEFNSQVGACFTLVQFNRKKVFFGKDRQQLVFDFARKSQGKTAVCSQLPGDRYQKEIYLCGLENFLCLEYALDRVEYSDEVVFFNHLKIL